MVRGFVPGTCENKLGCSEKWGGGWGGVGGLGGFFLVRGETDTHGWRADNQKVGGRQARER
jgi:hypothetical protein